MLLKQTYGFALLLLGDAGVGLDDAQVVELADDGEGAGLGGQLLVGAVLPGDDLCGTQRRRVSARLSAGGRHSPSETPRPIRDASRHQRRRGSSDGWSVPPFVMLVVYRLLLAIVYKLILWKLS